MKKPNCPAQISVYCRIPAPNSATRPCVQVRPVGNPIIWQNPRRATSTIRTAAGSNYWGFKMLPHSTGPSSPCRWVAAHCTGLPGPARAVLLHTKTQLRGQTKPKKAALRPPIPHRPCDPVPDSEQNRQIRRIRPGHRGGAALMADVLVSPRAGPSLSVVTRHRSVWSRCRRTIRTAPRDSLNQSN